MFEILTDSLDSLDDAPDVPGTMPAVPGGDVLFGVHGDIQNGSYVSVRDPDEVTASAHPV